MTHVRQRTVVPNVSKKSTLVCGLMGMFAFCLLFPPRIYVPNERVPEIALHGVDLCLLTQATLWEIWSKIIVVVQERADS